MKQNTSFVKFLTVKRIARVAGGISVGVLFWRRSREKRGHKSIWFSPSASPLASRDSRRQESTSGTRIPPATQAI